MSSSSIREPRHARTTIALHWLTAILIVALWSIGQTIDFAPRGSIRVDYRSLHMLLGVLLGIVIVIRLVWRIAKGGMLPDIQRGWVLLASRATHWLLYALIVSAVALGVLTAWTRGDSVFNVFNIPQFYPGDRATAHLVGGWHALCTNAIMIAGVLHTGAALFHHFVLRDATLRRMLPWGEGQARR